MDFDNRSHLVIILNTFKDDFFQLLPLIKFHPHRCRRLIPFPKGVKHQEWKDDIGEWPQVEHDDIHNHLILSRACAGEEMKNLKSMDSYIS